MELIYELDLVYNTIIFNNIYNNDNDNHNHGNILINSSILSRNSLHIDNKQSNNQDQDHHIYHQDHHIHHIHHQDDDEDDDNKWVLIVNNDISFYPATLKHIAITVQKQLSQTMNSKNGIGFTNLCCGSEWSAVVFMKRLVKKVKTYIYIYIFICHYDRD